MPRMPRLTPNELSKKLQQLDFVIDRQKGSHAVFVHALDRSRYLVLPMHNTKTIPIGTLSHMLKTSRIEINDLEN